MPMTESTPTHTLEFPTERIQRILAYSASWSMLNPKHIETLNLPEDVFRCFNN